MCQYDAMHTIGGVLKDALRLVVRGDRAEQAGVVAYEAQQNGRFGDGHRPWKASEEDIKHMNAALSNLAAIVPSRQAAVCKWKV